MLLELFKGTGSVGKIAKKMGFEVKSVDINPESNADITIDILDWDYKTIDPNKIEFIWASPPCETYSALVYRLKARNPQTAKPISDKAKLGTRVLYRTLDIIEYFIKKNPNIKFVIENPHGMMRKDPRMKKLPYYTTTLYCLYGDEKYKPTDFWSNYPLYLKSTTDNIIPETRPVEGMSLNDKYRMPPKLIHEILEQFLMLGNSKMSWNIHAVIMKDADPKEAEKILKGKPDHVNFKKDKTHYVKLDKNHFDKFRNKKINDNITIMFGRLKPEHAELSGGGFFDYFKKGIDYVKSGVKSITDRFQVKMDYTNAVKKVLLEQGNKMIKSIELYRYPVQEYYPILMDILTFGKFSKAKNELNYDKMFHLGMIITLEDNQKLLIEKNAVINISTNVSEPEHNAKTEKLIVAVDTPMTLNEFLSKARLRMGDKDYFSYEALSTNCQNYIKNLLEASGLYGQKENHFVFQDVEGIARQLPGISKKIISGILKTISIGHNVIGSGCWKGYKRVKGTKPYSKGSCEKIGEGEYGLDKLEYLWNKNMDTDKFIGRGTSELDAQGGNQSSGYVRAIMAKKAGYPDLDLTKMEKASSHITEAKVEAFYRYCLVNGKVNNKGLIPNIQQLYGDFLEQRARRQIPDDPVPLVPLPIPAVPEFQPNEFGRLERQAAEYYLAPKGDRKRLKQAMDSEFGPAKTKTAMAKARQQNSRANRRNKSN